MNEQPLYEQQIASKLEQLPVPDMADAIWLRIKDQLDADMPTGGHTPPTPPSPRSTGRGKLGLLSVIIVSLVLIYLITPKKQKHSPARHRTPADTSSLFIAPTVPPPGQQLPEKRKEPVRSLPAQRHDTAASVLPTITTPLQQDSIVITPPVIPPVVIPPAAAPVKKDSLPPKKKPRGVQGISDSSYKIVPKNNTNAG